MSDTLNLDTGDIIRHLKRGSEYEVAGFFHGICRGIVDGQIVRFGIGIEPNGETFILVRSPDETGVQGIHFEAMFQRSLPASGWDNMVVYRSMIPKPGEPWLFIRPAREFTTDRFELVQ